MSNDNFIVPGGFEASQGVSQADVPATPFSQPTQQVQPEVPAQMVPQQPVEELSTNDSLFTNKPVELDNEVVFTVDDSVKVDQEQKINVDTIKNEFMGEDDIDESKIKNTDKLKPSFALSEKQKIQELIDKEELLLQKANAYEDAITDLDSRIQILGSAFESSFTEAVEGMKRSFELIQKPLENLKRSLQGIGDASATIYDKYKDKDNVELKGNDAFLVMTALTGGMRRIALWNSGFYITLKSIPIALLNKFYREINGHDKEFGMQFGNFYYLFNDITIAAYVIEQLLPQVICGSTYTNWKTNELLSAISYQDFHTILWAMGLMMHPEGVNINFVCGECGNVHTEHADIGKLKLINTSLINEDMIRHFKSGKITNDKLKEYRKILNMDSSIELEHTRGDSKRKWRINLQQCSLQDHLSVGRDYLADLQEQCYKNNATEIADYNLYNRFRAFKPWIKSIEFIRFNGDQDQTFTFVNDGTEESDKSIYLALEEFRQYVGKEFEEKMKDYILSTKISHICYYLPACPKCGTEPKTGYHGYIPYDPLYAFFTLTLMKLLQDVQN